MKAGTAEVCSPSKPFGIGPSILPNSYDGARVNLFLSIQISDEAGTRQKQYGIENQYRMFKFDAYIYHRINSPGLED